LEDQTPAFPAVFFENKKADQAGAAALRRPRKNVR
jgi:hypothetical protein